jgi:NTE family protein
MYVHLTEAEDLVRSFSWSSRLNADWDFLTHPCELGRKSADAWISANFERIGVESTVDLEEKYFRRRAFRFAALYLICRPA